jgi:5-methylcytosine-specific restriction endonuclease McrA
MARGKPSPGWHKVRAVVIQRANGTCQVCHLAPAEEVTHIVKRQYPHPPAEQDMDNMIAVCKRCHPIFDARRDQRGKAKPS